MDGKFDSFRGKVHSARETPNSKNHDFSKLQYALPYQEIETNRESRPKEARKRDSKYKRCKSHRQNVQSDHNLPKSRVVHHQVTREEEQPLYFNKKELMVNNFHSI